MSEQDWGLKRFCQSCGIKFYDFFKSPIICPQCGTEYDPEAVVWGRRGDETLLDKDAVEKALKSESDENADELDDDIDLVIDKDIAIHDDKDELLEDDDDVDSEQLGVETYSDDDGEEI